MKARIRDKCWTHVRAASSKTIYVLPVWMSWISLQYNNDGRTVAIRHFIPPDNPYSNRAVTGKKYKERQDLIYIYIYMAMASRAHVTGLYRQS